MKHQQKVFMLHLNSASSCCRAYPEPLQENQTIQDVVDQWKHESELLNQGVEVKNCDPCWKIENQGKLSYRNYEGQDRNQFNRVEILLSNLCNQMCSYCSPKYSSVWEESIDRQGMFEKVSNTSIKNLQVPLKNQTTHDRLEELQSYILSCDDNSVSLALLGGEPLMQINSLQQLLAFSRNKIKDLFIITNLNPPKTKFLEWVLENFSKDKLQIQVSLDATPEYNHVPRAGFESESFRKNLDLVRHHRVDIEFMSTVSAISIFDLPNFLSWIDQNQFKAKFHLVNNPSFLNPTVVPFEFRRKILNSIDIKVPTLIGQILNTEQQSVDLKLFEQYNYLTQYFSRTNTDLTKINNPLFQEYWQWLTDQFKK
jgi:sulfatase maturation enzyme AslB (radical SAM superfamily)